MRFVVSAAQPRRPVLRRRATGPETTLLFTRSAPPGHVRPVGRLSPEDIPLPIADDVTAYICGSSGFADAASDALMDVGVPVERIRVERFGPTG